MRRELHKERSFKGDRGSHGASLLSSPFDRTFQRKYESLTASSWRCLQALSRLSHHGHALPVAEHGHFWLALPSSLGILDSGTLHWAGRDFLRATLQPEVPPTPSSVLLLLSQGSDPHLSLKALSSYPCSLLLLLP